MINITLDSLNIPVGVPHPLNIMPATRVTKLAMDTTVGVIGMIVETRTMMVIVVTTTATHTINKIIEVCHTGNLPPATNSRMMSIHSQRISKSTGPLGASLAMQSTGISPSVATYLMASKSYHLDLWNTPEFQVTVVSICRMPMKTSVMPSISHTHDKDQISEQHRNSQDGASSMASQWMILSPSHVNFSQPPRGHQPNFHTAKWRDVFADSTLCEVTIPSGGAVTTQLALMHSLHLLLCFFRFHCLLLKHSWLSSWGQAAQIFMM